MLDQKQVVVAEEKISEKFEDPKTINLIEYESGTEKESDKTQEESVVSRIYKPVINTKGTNVGSDKNKTDIEEQAVEFNNPTLPESKGEDETLKSLGSEQKDIFDNLEIITKNQLCIGEWQTASINNYTPNMKVHWTLDDKIIGTDASINYEAKVAGKFQIMANISFTGSTISRTIYSNYVVKSGPEASFELIDNEGDVKVFPEIIEGSHQWLLNNKVLSQEELKMGLSTELSGTLEHRITVEGCTASQILNIEKKESPVF